MVIVIILLLPLLILFWPALRHPDAILFPTFSPFTDVLVIHWPKARLVAQSWQAGDGLPLWTPLILSGMPLAANQLAMLFYPPAWLFLILPPEPVFNLLFIFHLLLGGLGVYFLLTRGHRLPPMPALVGSLAFALNGKWLAHVAGGHVSMTAAVGWMPWALLGLLMTLRPADRSPRRTGWLLLAAASLAMQALTHTLLLIYTAYLLLAATLWHTLTLPQPRAGPLPLRLGRFASDLLAPGLILLLASALAAVQLLPLAELAPYSNRTLTLTQAAEFSLTPPQLVIGLLLPTTQGGHEGVIYAGLIPLVLAPLGLRRHRRWSWFYGGVVVLAILYALGPATPVHRLFYTLLPGFRWVRTPARSFLVAGFALSVLAGFAVDRLSRTRGSPVVTIWLPRLTLFAGLLALLAGLGLAVSVETVRRPALALAIFVSAGLSVALLRVRQKISGRQVVIALGLLLVADLGWFDASMMRFVPREIALSPGRAAAEYLAQKPGLFRVYSPSYSLPMQTAATAGLHLAGGVEPVHLAVYDRFMARAGGYEDGGFSVTIPNFGDRPPETALAGVMPNLKLLGLLNVRYLAAAFPMDWPGLVLERQIDDTFIYRNEYALPRAWVAYRATPLTGDWLDRLVDLPDPGGVVLVEEGPFPESPAPATPRAVVRVTRYRADVIEVETDVAAAGWLVFSEIWYPGWQAVVNGNSRPVIRVNGLLRGVYLPQAGRYRVRLEYRPWSVTLGAWISILTAVGMGLWSIRQHRAISRLWSKRKQKTPNPQKESGVNP